MAGGLETGYQWGVGAEGDGKGLQGWVGWGDVEGFLWVALLGGLLVDVFFFEGQVSFVLLKWKSEHTFCPSGSSDSPCICTQPRFIPPAFSEWMAYSAFCSFGLLKNSRDCAF